MGGVAFFEPRRPRESPAQRWIRLHFWLTVVALLVWEVATVVIVRHAPGWFPPRWSLYDGTPGGQGGPHHELISRAVTLCVLEVAAIFGVYLRGGPEARVVAGLGGGALLLAFGVVEPALASLQLPIQVVDILVMCWIGAGHAAYALFGSNEYLR